MGPGGLSLAPSSSIPRFHIEQCDVATPTLTFTLLVEGFNVRGDERHFGCAAGRQCSASVYIVGVNISPD